MAQKPKVTPMPMPDTTNPGAPKPKPGGTPMDVNPAVKPKPKK